MHASVTGTARRWGRGLPLGLLLAIAGSFSARAAEPPELKIAPEPIAADASWSGRVRIDGAVSVEPGAVLTIAPGTTLRFAPGAGLTVGGVLRAEGTAEKPIVFQPSEGDPAPGRWEGLTLSGADTPTILRHCRISGAKAVSVPAGAHQITECEISAAETGIAITGRESKPVITNSRFTDIAQIGIEATMGSQPAITGNRFERCAGAGVAASQDAVPEIVGNTMIACGSGISLARTSPLIRDNTLRENRIGIELNLVSGGRPIQGNQVLENDIGIHCGNFSSPVISGNTVERNKEGIVCTLSSRPLVEGNRILKNGTGLAAIQISNPTLVGNLIEENDRGVYLHLSSYAVLHENDFDRNRLHLELGNMSSDWERRVGAKPARGRLQQTVGRLREAGGQAPAPPPVAAPDGTDGAQIMGSVDATNNWWGGATTREMDEKGADANIAGIVDYHDVPTRRYEGYPGEYVQDRVVYAPWAASPFRKAAPPPRAGEGRDGRP